jgi:hypothetical protein
VKEKEKLKHMLNTLPETYNYIGDQIDALKEENQTVTFVKNKIEIVEIRDKSDQGERKPNAFDAKKDASYVEKQNILRERQNGVQAGSNNGC